MRKLSFADRAKLYLVALIKTCVLFIHDQWVNICNQVYEAYCKYLCFRAEGKIARNLLYAYLDTYAILKDQNKYESSVLNSPPCTYGKHSTDGTLDVTYAVLAYYRVDTILSCFTLQEWMKRFDIDAKYINLIFLRDGRLFHSRLDLENDVETNTAESADTNLLNMPGKLLHCCGLYKQHTE